MIDFKDLKALIRNAYDAVRASLFEVEFERFVELVFDENLPLQFLCESTLPIDLFVVLSDMRRSGLNLDDFKRFYDFFH